LVCEFAAGPKTATRGLTEHLDCHGLGQLHIRVLLAENNVGGAVAAYRRWITRHGRDPAAKQQLALALLRWGLHHKDPAVRVAAIQDANLVDATALYADVASRLTDTDEVVRSWAAVAMSQTSDGFRVLHRQLRSSYPVARAVAVRALGKRLGCGALSTLAQSVVDPDPEVRVAFTVGLSSSRCPDALPVLLRLSRDPQEIVRAAAVEALGHLGRAGAYGAVLRAMEDPREKVRQQAACALARIAGSDARPELWAMALGSDLSSALVAGEALAELGAIQPVLNAVAKGLVDRRWTVRLAALRTAGSVKDRAVLVLARRALDDDEPMVRMAAAEAVFAHADRTSAVRTALDLRKVACSEPPRPRMEHLCLRASTLLNRAGGGAGLPSLLKLSREALSSVTRSAALQAALDGGANEELAIDALLDPEPQVKLVAARWIYCHAEREALAAEHHSGATTRRAMGPQRPARAREADIYLVSTQMGPRRLPDGTLLVLRTGGNETEENQERSPQHLSSPVQDTRIAGRLCQWFTL